jgi:hypothetical protein
MTRSTPFKPATDRGAGSDRRLLHYDKAGDLLFESACGESMNLQFAAIADLTNVYGWRRQIWDRTWIQPMVGIARNVFEKAASFFGTDARQAATAVSHLPAFLQDQQHGRI